MNSTLKSLCTCALCCALIHEPAAFAAEPAHTKGEEPIEEIVVTASPLDHAGDELAIPVTVLDRDHILGHLGTTLGETLAGEPGISTSSFAAGASRPVIRGQDTFRVRVLENGIGTHDVSTISADHGVPVNPLTVERVEVVRGPATLRYGGGAIAGVVNAINGRVPTRLGEPLSGEFYSGYSTGNRGTDAAFVLEGSRGPLALHLDGFRSDTDDYEIPDRRDRRQEFTDTDGWAFSAGGAWIGERGRLGLAWSRFDNDYGIPAPEDPAEPATIELDKETISFEADLDSPLPGIEQVRLRGARGDYTHDEVVLGVAAATFDNDEWEGRLEILHEPVLGFSGALGAHAQTKNLTAGGEAQELLAPTHNDALAVYLFEERDLADSLHLELGARVDSAELAGTGFTGPRRKRSFTPVSGSLALLWNASETLTFGLSGAITQRAPEALELYARGPHEADGTFQIGNPEFNEETARTVDLTVRSDLGRVVLEGSFFYTDYDRFTYGRLTGNSRDEDGTFFPDPTTGELLELVYEQDGAKFYGGELQGSLELCELLGGVVGLDAQADLVRARLDSGNVPRIPPARWGGGIYFNGDRVRARIGFLRAEEQDRLATFETKTDAYTMVDLNSTVRLLERDGRTLDLALSLRNATDERGRNHTSFKKNDVLLPGRSGRIALQARF